ncbi:MAG TPA: YciI family protein [Thermomicrobiales bacterium]|nr:YciI family protein [Thermomicrobiales bacterium]
MKYMLIIGNESSPWWNEQDPAAMGETGKAHQEFAAWCAERGTAIVSGAALGSPATAKTIRQQDGEFLITDGPHADLKESIGGFYVVDVAGFDDALEVARHCPMDPRYGIEVRTVEM